MKCEKCNHELNGNEKFCPSCGAEIPKKQEDKKKKNKKKWGTVLGFTICFIVGIGVIQFNRQYEKQNKAERKEQPEEEKYITEKKDVEENPVRQSEEDVDAEYIFPYSDTEYLEEKQVQALSQEQLAFARNEIIARHGRIFTDGKFKEYFEGKSWYTGTIQPEEFDENYENELNEVEKANIELIKRYEKSDEESIEEIARQYYGEFLEGYKYQELQGFKQKDLEYINPLFYIYNDIQLYYTILDLANDGVPELFISDTETIYGAFSVAEDGQIWHLLSPPGASLMGERTVYDICENNMIREISSGGATNFTISYLGVYPHAVAAKYEEIISRDGEKYYWAEDILPEGDVSCLAEATAEDCSEMENKYPLKQDIVWLKLSEFELEKNASENQEVINLKTSEDALEYLKQYLTNNGQYIPSHISIGDFGENDEYGEHGYTFRGYDDMGTHISTSFLYSVSSDGKIYDETMQEYIN